MSVSASLQATAKALITTRALVIKGETYELAEVEVYYHSKSHPDPYVHAHPEQKAFGMWYFHRASNAAGASYKGGTFKGLDLTLGNGDAYCGILIRSIYNPKVGMINGPCNVVDHILECYGVTTITDLVGINPMDATCNARGLILTTITEDPSPHEVMYAGPRIGLNEAYPDWRKVPYRLCRHFKLVKKDKRSLVACPS